MARIERLTEEQKDHEFGGYAEVDDTKIPVYWDADFPEDTRKMAICKQHIDEGTVAEAENEFYELGCRFPREGEQQLIRYRIECHGSRKIGKCAVCIVQYDADGNKIA